MGCGFLGHISDKERRYVRTFSGHRRYNVLGALDYATKRMLVVANDNYITATEVYSVLQKIADKYSGKEIHLILEFKQKIDSIIILEGQWTCKHVH